LLTALLRPLPIRQRDSNVTWQPRPWSVRSQTLYLTFLYSRITRPQGTRRRDRSVKRRDWKQAGGSSKSTSGHPGRLILKAEGGRVIIRVVKTFDCDLALPVGKAHEMNAGRPIKISKMPGLSCSSGSNTRSPGQRPGSGIGGCEGAQVFPARSVNQGSPLPVGVKKHRWTRDSKTPAIHSRRTVD